MEKITSAQLNEALNWRYAVKAFDENAMLTEDQVKTLLDTVNLAPTSFGLQPFQVYIIKDAQVREALIPHSFNQDKVANASHLLVFASEKVSNESVDAYIERAAKARPEMAAENLEAFAQMCKGFIANMDEATRNHWAKRQAYIALGTLMTAAALTQVDTCPIEGLNPAGYDEILGFKSKNLETICAVVLGQRAENDATQHLAKVRKTEDEIFTTV